MSENNNARILRFHLPDKVFHSMNAILWFALVITAPSCTCVIWMLPPAKC